jgi:hypothetical protein
VSVRNIPAYSGSLLMAEARNLYLAANGFSARDYDASTFAIGVLGLSLKLPNTQRSCRGLGESESRRLDIDTDVVWIRSAYASFTERF